MAVSRCSEDQMPGSGETRPKPVFCAMPTQPDHTSAAAGAAKTSSGQDRIVRPGQAVAKDRSAAAGPPVRGLEAPGNSPESSSRRSDCFAGSGPPRHRDVSGRPHPNLRKPPRMPYPYRCPHQCTARHGAAATPARHHASARPPFTPLPRHSGRRRLFCGKFPRFGCPRGA